MTSAKSSQRSTAYIVISWVIVVVWAGFIFFMSAHTGNDFKDGTDIVAQIKRMLDAWQMSVFGASTDIVSTAAHFTEYTIFGALLCNALRSHMPLNRAFVIAIVIASAYGVSDEIHQIFVPGRYCDVFDWATDTLGATLGSTIMRAILARRSK